MKQKTSKEYMRIPYDQNKIVEIVKKKIITKDGKRNIYCLCKEKDSNFSRWVPSENLLPVVETCIVTLNNESNGQGFKMRVKLNHMEHSKCSITFFSGEPDGNLKVQKGLHVALSHQIMDFFELNKK